MARPTHRSLSSATRRGQGAATAPRQGIRTATAADAPTGLLRLPAGVVDFSHVDTTPGAGGVLAPPPETDLDAAAYRALIRDRYRCDHGARQHLLSYARRINASEYHRATPIIGPFAIEARAILNAILEATHG